MVVLPAEFEWLFKGESRTTHYRVAPLGLYREFLVLCCGVE
jgi:hypothetical protein